MNDDPPIPGPQDGIYTNHWEQYFELGYSPLPVPYGQKYPPPDNTTGRHPTPSKAQCKHWAKTRPNHNIALRLPANVIGIDIDDYDGKHGAETITALEEHIGEQLPPSWTITSRTGGKSGIKLYRIPGGLDLKSILGPGVEIIRHRHRYAMAPPSVHPDGRVYRWVDPDEGVWSLAKP
jgi:hypothetical protein